MPTPAKAPGHPAYATPLDPARRRNHAGRIGVIARATGTPLMPWQEYAAALGTEMLDDGRYAYEIVVITVPRQSGKTTLVRSVNVDRCVSTPRAQCFYTAQKGKDARERWRDSVLALRASPFADQIKVRDSQGSERVVFPNGSEYRCFAPVDDALHGYTPPLVTLDEAMAYDQATGDALMAAIVPAQQTLRHRQLWIISTAGTARSTFLKSMLELGRSGEPGVALIDYSAPDDADPYDPATWLRYHPAINHVRPDGSVQVTVDTIRDAAGRLPRAEFERAYLNRWTVTAAQLVTDADMRATAGVDPVDASDVVLCYDAEHNRSAGAIVAVWRDDAGRVCARVVMAKPGIGWMPTAVTDLVAARRPLAVVAPPDGPVTAITDRLTAAGVDVTVPAAREFATATTSVLEAITTHRFRHDDSEPIRTAAAAVSTRPVLDGVAFSRRHSSGNVAAIMAMTAGLWVYDHRPVTMPQPLIYVPGQAS